jgi:hypothetical protein
MHAPLRRLCRPAAVLHLRPCDVRAGRLNAALSAPCAHGVVPQKAVATRLCVHTILTRGLLQIWVKPSAEMQFLYGNHVMKTGLGRITENTPANTGVVIYSMSDIPLGFGVSAKSTNDCRNADPNAIIAFHQADAGGCCWRARRSLCLTAISDQHLALPARCCLAAIADVGCWLVGEYLRAEDDL